MSIQRLKEFILQGGQPVYTLPHIIGFFEDITAHILYWPFVGNSLSLESLDTVTFEASRSRRKLSVR
jgi:hypothetical protein